VIGRFLRWLFGPCPGRLEVRVEVAPVRVVVDGPAGPAEGKPSGGSGPWVEAGGGGPGGGPVVPVSDEERLEQFASGLGGLGSSPVGFGEDVKGADQEDHHG